MSAPSSSSMPTGLARIEVRIVAVPLRRAFVAAHGVERERRVVLVRAEDTEGAVGWGEVSTLSAPTYTPEWTDSAFALLRDHLLPGLFVEGPSLLDRAVRATPMAVAGVRLALVDLDLRRCGRSLADHLGATSATVGYSAVLGVEPDDGVDALVAAARRAVAEGARLVKIKIRPGWDVEPLWALRDTLDVPVAADANGAYAVDGVPDTLDGLGLAYLEQPLAADDEVGHAELASRWATPVALDESVADLDAAQRLVEVGAADVLNVKSARLGGIDRAAEVVRWAGSAGVEVFVGGMLELGVGRAAALALAALAGAGHGALPTDCGPTARYVADDLTPPIDADADGWLPVPRGPGIGCDPLPERVQACTRAVAEVRPE